MDVPAQVWVDFNDLDEQGQVSTLRKFFAPGGGVVLGERLMVGDDEGNRCEGTVVAFREHGLVVIQLDGETFRSTGHPAPAQT